MVVELTVTSSPHKQNMGGQYPAPQFSSHQESVAGSETATQFGSGDGLGAVPVAQEQSSAGQTAGLLLHMALHHSAVAKVLTLMQDKVAVGSGVGADPPSLHKQMVSGQYGGLALQVKSQ